MHKKLHQKVASFKDAIHLKETGLYPYFRTIQSSQGTEVILNNKRVLMFGSNSYLGLTNHPRIIEAAKKAVKNIQSKVEKPTLGDLGALAQIKEKLQQEEKGNKGGENKTGEAKPAE